LSARAPAADSMTDSRATRTGLLGEVPMARSFSQDLGGAAVAAPGSAAAHHCAKASAIASRELGQYGLRQESPERASNTAGAAPLPSGQIGSAAPSSGPERAHYIRLRRFDKHRFGPAGGRFTGGLRYPIRGFEVKTENASFTIP